MGRPSKFVSRAGWGARPKKRRYSTLNARLSTVHYEGPRMGVPSHDECASIVRGIQDYHMDGRGWNDIAYTCLVCQHGYVYEGRGTGARTAANGTNTGNDQAYAVQGMCGAGDPVLPDMVTGITEACEWLRTDGGAGPKVNGHRDWKPTQCPGDTLYGHVTSGTFERTPTPPPEDDDMTPAQEQMLADLHNWIKAQWTPENPVGKAKGTSIARLIESNTRVEANQQVIARAIAQLSEVQGKDFQAQLIDIAESREREALQKPDET